MAEKRKIFVVVNPEAGGGSGRRHWPRISRELKERLGNFDAEETTAIGHARMIAEDATEAGYDLVIACGGDGTIHEVVNGLFDAKKSPPPTLGIICLGTGADLIKTLGIPKDISAQIKIIAGGKGKKIDLGRVTYRNAEERKESRLFVNIADAGLGADVVRLVEKSRQFLGRRLAYLGATLRSYAAWRPTRIEIVTDHSIEIEWPSRPIAVVVANGRYFGGGMPIAPRSDPCDGYFDLIAIGEMSPLMVPLAAPLLYAKQLDRLPSVRTDRVRSVQLTSDDPVGLDIDGEPIGSLPATFEMLPKALEVCLPLK